jgi:hypothetical protein
MEKSQGEEEALEQVTEEDIDPREECRLSARDRGAREEAMSLPGRTRDTWPHPISFRPRTARVKSSGRPWRRASRTWSRSKSSSLALVA